MCKFYYLPFTLGQELFVVITLPVETEHVGIQKYEGEIQSLKVLRNRPSIIHSKCIPYPTEYLSKSMYINISTKH